METETMISADEFLDWVKQILSRQCHVKFDVGGLTLDESLTSGPRRLTTRKATELVVAIEERHGLHIDNKDIVTRRLCTVRGLYELLRERAGSRVIVK